MGIVPAESGEMALPLAKVNSANEFSKTLRSSTVECENDKVIDLVESWN